MKAPAELQRHLQLVPLWVPLRDRLKTLSEVAKLPPADPLVGSLLYRDTLVLYSAEQGTFKSFFAVGLSCAVASGQDWGHHRVPQGGRVLYVAAEGVKGVGWRVHAWCQANGVDPAEVEANLDLLDVPFQLADEDAVAEAVELVRERGYALVVLDTRARSTVGLEENSATDQGRAVENCERLRRAADCTVLVLHHAGKNGTQRGTTAWPAAAWSVLTSVKSGPDDLGLTVAVEKHKDAELSGPHSFDLQPVEVPGDRVPHQAGKSTLVAVPTRQPHTSVPTKADREAGRADRLNADVALLDAWDPPPSGLNDVVRRSPKSESGASWGKPKAQKVLAAWRSANGLV